MEKINLKELNEMQDKEQYQVKTSNRSAAVEHLDDDDVDINGAWKSIRETITISAQSYYKIETT
jgi:hypothetical protein